MHPFRMECRCSFWASVPLLELHDWSDLNRTIDRAGDFGGELYSLVEILAIKNIESAQLFFRLSEWPIGSKHFTTSHLHCGSGSRRHERLAPANHAALLYLL